MAMKGREVTAISTKDQSILVEMPFLFILAANQLKNSVEKNYFWCSEHYFDTVRRCHVLRVLPGRKIRP